MLYAGTETGIFLTLDRGATWRRLKGRNFPTVRVDEIAIHPRDNAMIVATHEMAFARRVADEVCFLHEGLIVERGEPERIFTAPQRPETQRFLRRLLDAGRL